MKGSFIFYYCFSNYIEQQVVQIIGSELHYHSTKTKETNKMPTTVKVSPSQKNQERLAAKTWEKAYTQIPNSAWPAPFVSELDVIYQALTGQNLPTVGFTYLARATNGVLKKIYSPSVYKSEGGDVIIRWGVEDIPLNITPGGISVPGNEKKLKFSIKEDTSGKFAETVLSASLSKDGTIYTMSFPFRFSDWENPLSAEALEMVLEETPHQIADILATAPDPNQKSESSVRLVGPIIKVAYLPIGSYSVINYTAKESSYGMDYQLQVVVDEPFTAPSNVKVGDNWEVQEVLVENLARVKPNTSLKKLLNASPIINPANPATLHVDEHGEWQGHPTAKARLIVSSFLKEEDSIDLEF